MSKRVHPQRKRCPEFMIPLIEEAIDLKLFLVHEYGPTNFEFKQEDGKKFKIQIGSTINCSICKTNDHCVHSLYVQIKIFKRACVFLLTQDNDELLYQQSYLDNEISQLIASRFGNQGQVKKQTNYLKRGLNKPPQGPEKQSHKFRHDIDQDEICCICHENLTTDQPLTYCNKKCGTNFHVDCLKIWVGHKQNYGQTQANCPICRSAWDSNILVRLETEKKEFEDRFLLHKFKCHNCGRKPIKGNLYKCIFCTDFYSCQSCLGGFPHDHDSYIVKKKVDLEYEPFIPKQKKTIKNDLVREIFQSSRLIREEIFGFLIDSIPNKNDMDPVRMSNQQDKKQIKDLQIIGFDAKKNKYFFYHRDICVKCNREQKSVKRLPCGHLIDEHCLEKIIRSEDITTKLKCPVDDQIICPGYYQTIYNQLKKQIQNLDRTNIRTKTPNTLKRLNSTENRPKRQLMTPQLPSLNVQQDFTLGQMIKRQIVQPQIGFNKPQKSKKILKPIHRVENLDDLAIQGFQRQFH